MPCAVALVPPARPKRTRGLTAGASEAQEITTSVDRSLPQLRWICSGVPSGLAAAALLAEARLPAAVASPEAPASLRKPRRETVATCSASGISSMFLFDMSGVLVFEGRPAHGSHGDMECRLARRRTAACRPEELHYCQACYRAVTSWP